MLHVVWKDEKGTIQMPVQLSFTMTTDIQNFFQSLNRSFECKKCTLSTAIVFPVRGVDVCDLVYSTLQSVEDACFMIHPQFCAFLCLSDVISHQQIHPQVATFHLTTFCFLCLASVECKPRAPHFPKWTKTGWIDRDKLMPYYPWTKSQLAWILNLTHECPWFIDAVPQEKFTPMSKGYCFTLAFDSYSDSDCITVEWYIVCQVSDVSRPLKFAFVSNVYMFPPVVSECLVFRVNSNEPPVTFPTWCSVVILVPTVLHSSQHHLHCKSDSNDSLGSLGNQVLRDQERSISHFSSEQRDKEMVRQRESGRERGLERESGVR